MKEVRLKITHDDGVDDFLGVNVLPETDGTIHLTQPHLINSVLTDLRLVGTTVQPKYIPCPSTVVPGRDLDAAPFDSHFHYQAVIGKLNFLEKTTRATGHFIRCTSGSVIQLQSEGDSRKSS